MQRKNAIFLGFGGSARLVLQIQNLGTQERAFLIEFHDLKALSPLGHKVKAAVRIFFRDGRDLGATADVRDPLLDGANHSELALIRETLPDHFFIARLKNVKWQWSTGEKHYIQRE